MNPYPLMESGLGGPREAKRMIGAQRVVDGHMHYFGTFLPKGQNLLDYMADNGIDAAVVNTLNTTANLGRFNGETAKTVWENRNNPHFDMFTEFHQAGQPNHEEVDKLFQKAPDRIYPFFWYNPIDPADSDQQKGLKLVEAALTRGYKGVKLQLAMTSCPVERLELIAHFCQEREVPLYIHPSGAVFGAHRTSPFEIAALAKKHPALKIILGHAGYTMEFVIEAAVACMETPNIYFETSLSIPFSLITYIKLFGVRRVIFGTDAPSAGPFRIEYEKIMTLTLTEKERALILAKNLEKLLKIEKNA